MKVERMTGWIKVHPMANHDSIVVTPIGSGEYERANTDAKYHVYSILERAD